LVTDWAPSPPAPVLAGRLVAGAALVGPVVGAVVEVELELELLLQPAAASAAATTAAKPILLSLRTVVPPGVGRSCRLISPKVEVPRDSRAGAARRWSFSSIRPWTASASAYGGGSAARIRLPPGAAGIRSMACSDGIEKPG